MKIEIERVSTVSNSLVLDPKKIDYKQLTENFEEEGVEIEYDLNSKNIEKFLNENQDQLSQIFYVMTQYGHAKLGQDSFSDDSNYYLKILP
jgi:hypothetical protein